MTVIPLKRAFRTVVGGVWGEEATGTEHDVRCVRVADFDYPSLLVGERSVTYRSVPDTQLPNRLLKNGDLVIEKSGGGENTVVGRAVQWSSTARAITSNFMARLEPQPDHNGRYLTYVLAHLYFTGVIRRYIKQTTGIQNLDLHAYLQEKWDFPNKSDQTAIAAFLDHETAHIDELVREQEQLLEDLAEKRRATVNHATKAAVPLDASALPAGWRNVPLKTLLTSFEQGWSPQCENRPAVEGEWGVLKVGCVNGHTFNAEENKVLPDDLEPLTRYSLKQDDVLISRANTRDLVGSAARVERDYPNLLLCDKLYRLRTDAAQLRPAYLVLLLNSPIARAAIETSASGASASMVNISQGTIRNLLLPIPPLGEQDAIIAHLDERLAQIDQLVLEVRANIEDMKLLRSTLITAATTGKIDVRDWRPA